MYGQRALRREGLNKTLASCAPPAPSCAGAEVEMEGETLPADIE